MKRIVQCPKCEAKLAVFDIGKPINQKCPRCGNAFEIASEESKSAPAAAATEAAAAAPEVAAPSATQPDTATAQPAEKKKATSKMASKKGAAKDKETADTAAAAVTEKPAAGSPAPAEPAPAQEGSAPATPSVAPATPTAPAEEKKEITVKKPIGKPVAMGTPRPPSPEVRAEASEPVPAHGVSFLHIMVIFGLLILAIVMQVLSAKKAEARFNALDVQLKEVMKQIQANNARK